MTDKTVLRLTRAWLFTVDFVFFYAVYQIYKGNPYPMLGFLYLAITVFAGVTHTLVKGGQCDSTLT